MSTRSLTLKNGFLAWLCATPTTTLSNRVAARRTKSSWPRVSGSNVPGYTATIIGLSFELRDGGSVCSNIFFGLRPGSLAPTATTIIYRILQCSKRCRSLIRLVWHDAAQQMVMHCACFCLSHQCKACRRFERTLGFDVYQAVLR